jgi:hypothetical protein
VIWFAVVSYVLLSPVVCLLVGRGIRMRDAERPVEQCQPEVEATPAPADVEAQVDAEPAAQTAVVPPGVPVAV